jgi:16S rRNA G1207 methylase RsmC
VSVDFGAGNGLQALLLQKLYPHRRTVQVEISSRMVEAGKDLQQWLGIDEQRVEWVVGDVLDNAERKADFIYLYRPVRPEGEGRLFYEHLSSELNRADRKVVIFSVADCLSQFLSEHFEVVYGDGHLTCFRNRL